MNISRHSGLFVSGLFVSTLFILFFYIMLRSNMALAAYDSGLQATQGPLSLVRMVPEGNNAQTLREIVFTFDRDVVPLGQMERTAAEIPITITPAVKCQWRWFSRNTLGCRLDESDSLKEATEYTVVIKPGIKTEDGNQMDGPVTKSIITQRPALTQTGFKTWRAPDIPVLRLTFNQPVAKSSVLRAVSFDTGTAFDITVDDTFKEEPLLLPLPWEPLSFLNTQPRLLAGDDQANMLNNDEYRRNWLVQPRQGLGIDSTIRLQVKPGLVSAHGPLSGNQDTVLLTFDTFPQFSFLGLRCYPSAHKNLPANNTQVQHNERDGSVLIQSGTPIALQVPCDPLKGTGLQFSTPVIIEEIKQHVTLSPDLAGGRKDYDPWQNSYRYTSLNEPHRKGQTYTVWFPEFLKANQPYQLSVNSQSLRDEFGSTLPNAININFATDHRSPKFHMPYEDAVLEANIDSEQPVIVTNLDSLNFNFSRLTASGGEYSLDRTVTIPKAPDIAFRFPLGIRNLLNGQSGVVAGSFTPSPAIEYRSHCDSCFFSQVTPWQVHAKIGHFNSLVWVVDFATGLPISDAHVELFLGSRYNFATPKASVTEGMTGTDGVVTIAGSREFDPQLDIAGYETHWYVKVTKGNDIALLPLNYNYRVYDNNDSGYRYYDDNDESVSYPNRRRKFHHIHTWGATAQGIYRIGDTMQYKVYVRDQDNKQFVKAPENGYSLNIIDPKGNIVTTRKDITLNEFGAFSGEYTLAKSAPVGWYQFEITSTFTNKTWHPLKVLVADFTPAPFKANNELDGDQFVAGDTMTISSHARLHAGGPYTDAKTRVTVNLTPARLTIKDAALKNFEFDTFSGSRDTILLNQTQGQLDKKGDFTNTLTLTDTDIIIGRLSVETAIRDDRGKYIATQTSARYIGRDRFIGLQMPGWYLKTREASKVSWVVVDENGQKAKGADVEIRVELDEVTAARVKGAGNTYLTQYKHAWKEITKCTGTSGSSIQACEFTPAEPGSYRITGTVTDTQSRKHTTTIDTWASGHGYVLWDEPTDNTLQVIPMQESYKVGDVAKFLVKNPYPDGTALISIERYGVMRHFKQVWSSSTPVIEIPIEADDVPGFYLSIMVMSPRAAKPIKDGVIDLGKPAFKIAYRQIDVIDPVKKLTVNISSDKETYKPREKAKIRLEVKGYNKKIPAEKQEIAVAVLDESVFDLLQGGNKNFDPYQGFYYLDGRDMENFSLLTRLIGRQNFPRKGANPGGDGGSSLDMRTLFKFVSYWNPSVITDSDGKATIEVELPDNLTGWRVLAMATTPTDKMGLGEHTFTVNKSIELRPVMPNQITEGDEFMAGFTVMNRTRSKRTINVKLTSAGAVKKPGMAMFKVKTRPFVRETLWLPIASKGDGNITVTATAVDAGNNAENDALQHNVPVNKYRSLVTAANYGTTTQNSITDTLAVPADIYGDVGNIQMIVSPSVIANVDGAFDYIREYPYWCWEQRLTKAVMAAHYLKLKPYLSVSDWHEAESLPQQMLDDASLFQAPNGGMTFWIANDEYVSPYLSAYTQLAFNWLRRHNHTVPAEVESRLKAYLHNLLARDVFPDFYSSGMSSSIRAVALAALAENNDITLSDLQRYRSAVPTMDLFGKAHYLQAAMRVKGSETIVRETLLIILGQATQSGGKFQFNEKWDDSYSQMLATPLRSNCAILESLVYLGENPLFAPSIGDIPFKLVRSITQSRGARTHFENTQENVFCMNSIVSYSKIYEAEVPDMHLKVSLDKAVIGENRFTRLTDPAVTHGQAIRQSDVGTHKKLTLEKEGKGRVYYSSRIQYAPLAVNTETINAGIEIIREYSIERNGKWELLTSPLQVKRGELVRVDLYISIPTSRNFVVVNDPVPGGFEAVNRDLATTSLVDANKGEFQAAGNSWFFHYDEWSYYGASYWSFYHKELRHDSARFYSDYLPAGNYHLSYTAQAIAEGHFRMQPAIAEEMYDPDVFGKSKPDELDVTIDQEN